MSLPTPQFIPLKKGKECFAVPSWRLDSPAMKPTTAPPPPPPQGSPQTRAGVSPGLHPSEQEAHSAKKSRGKGGRTEKGNVAAAEPTADDFFVRFITCAPDFVKVHDVEVFCASQASELKPLRILDIGSPRSVPLKRLEGDEAGNSPATHPADALAPPTAQESGRLICLLYAEQAHAEAASKALLGKWPAATTEVVNRRRTLLNASLVIKGLPFATRCDLLAEELDKLAHKPSYVRLHRGERGVFKCVVFVKYSDRLVAEQSKLELERLIVGNRPLKVEFKKKAKDEAAAGGKAPSLLASLDQLVRDLRVSKENEGFTFGRSQLAKEEIRYLKQISLTYDLLFELSVDSVTVKRKLPAAGEPKPQPSPALRPVTTPQWAPATPGSLLPMDFRGIRHWKELRQANAGVGGSATAVLGIIRPIGPHDVPAFASGRGRPLLLPPPLSL